MKKLMIKLAIYKDQLQCPSSKQAIRKSWVVSNAMKNTISRNPSYKPSVGYKFYCKVKCLFLVNECTLSLVFKAVINAYELVTIIRTTSQGKIMV